MSKTSFHAGAWLKISPLPSKLEDTMSEKVFDSVGSQKAFSPDHFFTPGWTGDSLLTKHSINLSKDITELWSDAISQFKQTHNVNRTRKIEIYDEFMGYAGSEGLNFSELDSFSTFWDHSFNPSSPYREAIDSFIEVYCFRSVILYLYKIKFFVLICNEVEFEATGAHLLNPSYLFSLLFKKGSKNELKCDSLTINAYSWFRPSPVHQKLVENICNKLVGISTAEMMKICCYKTMGPSKKQDNEKGEISHSLSHRSFGLFINDLMVYFPQWVRGKLRYKPESRLDSIEILNTKFQGDDLDSLSRSHWLAQETNSDLVWDEILCPEFIGNCFENGKYSRYCHELQFLIFICSLAKKQSLNPIDLICLIFKKKYQSESASSQLNLLNECAADEDKEVLYKRTLLNLSKFPKKNPHHYLLQKIYTELPKLHDDGFLYVLSNQKLFVPSQSEKIEQLTKKLKVDACFHLDSLKGKGEIPNFLYIFSKRKNLEYRDSSTLLSLSPSSHIQEACLSFRLTGYLAQFSSYQKLVDEFENFMLSKQAFSTPIFQKELEHGLTVEFHQDAIIDGKLLSSTNKDQNSITHPQFFKNITRKCLPLDQFFNVESLGSEKKDYGRNILGVKSKDEKDYPLVLIVDYSSSTEVNIELVPSSSYRAKLEQYGAAYYQYFGLIPKVSNINLNIFREYFLSNIGKQVIALSLAGGMGRCKSKVKSLLIPKFFIQSGNLPESVIKSFSVLNISSHELDSIHPKELAKKFQVIEPMIHGLVSNHPWFILSTMTEFKNTLSQYIESVGKKNNSSQINYENPVVMSPLLELESRPLSIDNPDIFLEFHISNREEIHTTLSTMNFLESEGRLELLNEDSLVASLHGDKDLLQFIRFIFSKASNARISDLLQGLRIPKKEEFHSVISNYDSFYENLDELSFKTKNIISTIFIGHFNSH